MSVNSPRYYGHYSQRASDCQLAIERDFLKHTLEAGTPYLDLDAILSALADDATKAGWTEEELTEAVMALAKQHRMTYSNTSPK